MPTSSRASPLAIYIHWPFCRSKCPYCDFNSHVRDAVDEAAWEEALLQELGVGCPPLEGVPPLPLGEGRVREKPHTDQNALTPALSQREREPSHSLVTSIFFGGGTPSLMPPRIVERLIAQIHRQYRVAEDVEITLEANPTSSEASRFRDFRAAGVNRLSMGIQSLDPASLTFLGRTHSVTEALHAWEAARSIFPRHSFDMIYARPGQTALQWERELQQALTHAGDHLSLYQLTIEPGTAFAQQYRKGTLTLPPDDEAVALYSLTREMMEAAGRPWYEISNYAAPGEACRHNLNYWRSVEYLGIGPGAHGRVMHQGIRHATVTERSPEKWLERVQQHGHGRVECTPLTQTERAEEVLLMGLRLREGIHAEDFAQRAGMKLLEAINEAALSMLVREGLLTFDANRLATTTSGILVLNRVIAELAA